MSSMDNYYKVVGCSGFAVGGITWQSALGLSMYHDDESKSSSTKLVMTVFIIPSFSTACFYNDDCIFASPSDMLC